MTVRVCLINNFAVPYQIEFVRAVRSRTDVEIVPLFLAGRDPNRQWPNGEIEGAELVKTAPSWLPLPFRPPLGLGEQFRRLAPDVTVVCGYSYFALQAAMSLTSRAGRPFLFWSELPRLDAGGHLARGVRAFLMRQVRRTAGVLAIGRRAARAWADYLGPKVPIFEFPYVCNLDRYFAIERGRRTDGAFTYLFSGQLIPRKGVDILIRAFNRAAVRDPRLRLLVAGEGPERTHCESLVAPAVRDRVEFLGHVSWQDLPRVYARADALTIPSRHDGWGLVVNEAFAAGLPVIGSTSVGAALDLVDDGMTGFLFETGDDRRLEERLLELPAGAPAMGEAARAVARARLTTDRAAGQFADILARVAHA